MFVQNVHKPDPFWRKRSRNVNRIGRENREIEFAIECAPFFLRRAGKEVVNCELVAKTSSARRLISSEAGGTEKCGARRPPGEERQRWPPLCGDLTLSIVFVSVKIYALRSLASSDGVTHGEATAPTATPQTWNEKAKNFHKSLYRTVRRVHAAHSLRTFMSALFSLCAV